MGGSEAVSVFLEHGLRYLPFGYLHHEQGQQIDTQGYVIIWLILDYSSPNILGIEDPSSLAATLARKLLLRRAKEGEM